MTDSPRAKGLEQFFTYVWRNTEGYVYLPVMREGNITEYHFKWPQQKSAVVKHVLRNVAIGADVHYSPALFKNTSPQKENVLGTWTLWADFDGTAPEKWDNPDIPAPTLEVQSSGPNNRHTYWALDNFLTDIPTIDERNRSLAYALKADTSGWDANQFLRPPFTVNTGFGKEGRKPVEVKIAEARKGRLNLKAFADVPSLAEVVQQDIQLSSKPAIEAVIREAKWSTDMWNLFHSVKDEVGDRSAALTKLAFFGVEDGFTNEQIYAVIENADERWEKYTKRRDREKRLLDIITYVREKKGHDPIETPTPPQQVVGDKVVYGFQDILDAEVSLEWIMEGLIPVQGFGVISGDPGVGKTQLGIQLACSLALGEDFVGWKNSGGKRKVLFLSLEMSLPSVKYFMGLIANEYKDDISRHTLQQNFMTLPLGEGIPFDRPEGQAFIDSLLQEYMPDVLFIDSLQKTISKELTDELAIRSFTEYLKKHVRHKYNTAVYIIHHNRKGQSGDRGPATLNDLHGSRFLSAELDFSINVSKYLKGSVTIDNTKNRLAAERDRFDLQRNENLKFSIIDESRPDNPYAHNVERIGYGETVEGNYDSRGGSDGPSSTFTL